MINNPYQTTPMMNNNYMPMQNPYADRMNFLQNYQQSLQQPVAGTQMSLANQQPMPQQIVGINGRIVQAVENINANEVPMIDDKYDILCVSLIPGAGKTTIEKMFNALVAGWFPNDFCLFYSHSGDITRMYYDGVYDIVTNADEYAWNEIFPNLTVTSTNAKLEQFNIGKYKPLLDMCL